MVTATLVGGYKSKLEENVTNVIRKRKNIYSILLYLSKKSTCIKLPTQFKSVVQRSTIVIQGDGNTSNSMILFKNP